MSSAQPVAFAVHPWPSIRDHCAEIAHLTDGTAAVLAIVDSVIASGCADDLVAHTPMHDLLVTATPEEPEAHPSYGLRVWDYLEIAASGSFDRFATPDHGKIAIAHHSSTGRVERIVRPTTDAVPLFWRFMAEKYGISRRL